MFNINTRSKILITGGGGFLGQHVVKELLKKGYDNLFIPRSKKYDLKKPTVCHKLVKKSDIVIHLAAKVGGIGFNQLYPADLYYENLSMGLNVLYQAYKCHIQKLIIIGTVCAYPKYTPVPFSEENLWEGYPESTNAPYGLAKKILLVGTQAFRKQYNLNAIYLLPVNLYGPEDKFDLDTSHVIPAMIKKITSAKINNIPAVTLWGTGSPTREFLYVEDAARAIVLAMEKYNKSDPVNIGSGIEISISNLANKIKSIIGYKGKIIWDKTKPDGQPRRLLNTDLAEIEFKFKAKTDFNTGLKKTIKWYLNHYENK